MRCQVPGVRCQESGNRERGTGNGKRIGVKLGVGGCCPVPFSLFPFPAFFKLPLSPSTQQTCHPSAAHPSPDPPPETPAHAPAPPTRARDERTRRRDRRQWLRPPRCHTAAQSAAYLVHPTRR